MYLTRKRHTQLSGPAYPPKLYDFVNKMAVQMPSSPSEFPTEPASAHDARLNDVWRLNALDNTGLMDSPEEEAFDRAVRLATAAIGAPIGLVSLVDGQRQFFKAQTGLNGWAKEDRQTPLSHSFCQYVTSEDQTLFVDDARDHPLLASNGAVGDLGVVAYMGVPIHAPDGQPLGSFCAIFGEAHHWTDREKAILADITAMLELEIALRAETEAKELLFNEMVHRMGNLFSIVLGMIKLNGRRAASVEDLVGSLTDRIMGLQRAHSLVRPDVMTQSAQDSTVSLHTVISNLVEPHLHVQHEQMTLAGPTLQASPKASTNLALVVHELATNAAKYGALSTPEGRISVTWDITGEMLELTWVEQGGPEIDATPDRSGFGSRLIDLTVRNTLKGQMSTNWLKSGVKHVLTLPIAELQ